MKAAFIEANAHHNYHRSVMRLQSATSLEPLRVHFFKETGRLYIRVPDDIPAGKFVCAAKNLGLSDAKESVNFSVIEAV